MSDFHVQVRGAPGPAMCGPDMTILDACIQAGLGAPYNCRSGECGECMAELAAGEVSELPGADPAVFDDGDRAAGRILTCMCYPRSDLEIEVPLRAGPADPPRRVDTVVEAVTPLSPTVTAVAVTASRPVPYRAGQCFEWVLPGISPNRVFSAANRPGTARLEFHVRLYPGGKVGELVRRQLLPGDRLELIGPFGQFGLSANDWRPALCVAGGTGLAPLKAALDEAFANGDPRKIHLLFGARTRAELYCLDVMRAWQARHRNFTFTPVLSDAEADQAWDGARGLVTEALERQLGDPFGVEAYVCGPPGMIDAAVDVLERAGVEADDIHCDRFAAAR